MCNNLLISWPEMHGQLTVYRRVLTAIDPFIRSLIGRWVTVGRLVLTELGTWVTDSRLESDSSLCFCHLRLTGDLPLKTWHLTCDSSTKTWDLSKLETRPKNSRLTCNLQVLMLLTSRQKRWIREYFYAESWGAKELVRWQDYLFT